MNDGGPAFPCETIHPCGSHEQVDGMSIRDFFAAMAVMGLGCNPNHVSMTDDEIAKWSYNLADAMLKVRI